MTIYSTHTYAVMDVSDETYDEIRDKLVEANYEHTFHEDSDGNELLDMAGIALRRGEELIVITKVGGSA